MFDLSCDGGGARGYSGCIDSGSGLGDDGGSGTSYSGCIGSGTGHGDDGGHGDGCCGVVLMLVVDCNNSGGNGVMVVVS